MEVNARSERYTKGFWIGMIFFIIGILMILLGSPPQLELLGSVCSIGFMWAVAERIASPVVGILHELHESMRALHQDFQNLRQDLHDGYASLHKDHQEILKALRRRSST
jgi:hypothetical protein